MSSDGSVTSGSRIRQFGLYRTIDARTDEFLRSSRRRQIRQGCACAAISTAITVTVVVVILLIYEYAIAVEWSLVQNKKGINATVGSDQPFADRLDRSYFGFDQEYFERMPLLINALQESSYVDPTIEMSVPLSKKRRYNVTISKTTIKPTLKPSPVRRTSPRPFYFEYRHPTPLPFSKTYGSRNWVERYRNEERLKNIRQIIKYLENTINAKAGDMHTKPTEKHIAFTGVYIEPMLETKTSDADGKLDLQSASSNTFKKFHKNHLADPLFNFKPENPGDVNLLADDFLRFSPISTPSLVATPNKYPMFRQIPFPKRNCQGNKCENNDGNKINLSQSSSDIRQTETPPVSTTKSFSVMLNLYPIKAQTENTRQEFSATTQAIDKIYLTTLKPKIQFKRKPNVTFRRVYTPYKRPRYLSNLINKDITPDHQKEIKANNQNKDIKESEPDTQMIVHVKVYDEATDLKNKTAKIDSTTFTPSTQVNPYTSIAPIEFSTAQIEDYHVGSSGYIPVSPRSDKSLPKVTSIQSFIDTTTEYWNSPSSTTPVVKFSIEDAKVPDQYMNYNTQPTGSGIELLRRNSGEMIEHEKLLEEMSINEDKITAAEKKISEPTETNLQPSTLVVKLKNDFSKTTTDTNQKKTDDISEATTTVWTYVPQINGHYRSINQNSRNVNKWLNNNSEPDRKKRLEMSVSGFRTYVPMYKEIKRNNTKIKSDESDVKSNTKDVTL